MKLPIDKCLEKKSRGGLVGLQNLGNTCLFGRKIVMWLSATKSPSNSKSVTRPAVPTPVEFINKSPFLNCLSSRIKSSDTSYQIGTGSRIYKF